MHPACFFLVVGSRKPDILLKVKTLAKLVKHNLQTNTDFYFHKETFDLLKKQNIEIINLTDIIDKNLIDIKTVREYYTDSFHPSEKYWDIFTPAIIKYLNL